jgi:hypothetical protein
MPDLREEVQRVVLRLPKALSLEAVLISVVLVGSEHPLPLSRPTPH